MTARIPQPGDLEPIETASRDEISALQLERLKWSVRHSYDNVAPYHARCVEKGVHPDDLKTLADLAKFPFMTKPDLRDHYPFGLFAVPRTKLARLPASSGTTGKPAVGGYTKNDIDNWPNVVARSIRAAGGRYDLLASLDDDLRFVLICSKTTLVKVGSEADETILVTPSAHKKCERCWHYRDDVGHDAAHPELCGRCTSNLYGTGEARSAA